MTATAVAADQEQSPTPTPEEAQELRCIPPTAEAATQIRTEPYHVAVISDNLHTTVVHQMDPHTIAAPTMTDKHELPTINTPRSEAYERCQLKIADWKYCGEGREENAK